MPAPSRPRSRSWKTRALLCRLRERLHEAVVGLRMQLAAANDAERDAALRRLDAALTAGLPRELARLAAALRAAPFDRGALPAALAARWLASDGRELVEVTAAEDVSDNAAARRFITAVHGIVPTATGLPVVYQEASATVVAAFERALLYAFIMVSAIIWLVLRDVKDTLLVLVPIALASILTAALTVLVDMPFNYANIIALPLLGRHRRRQRHPCGASHAHRGRGAAVQHQHDAGRARERAHDRRELRQPRVLVARRHGEHGHSAGAWVGGEHDRDADRAAGVAEGVAAEADGRRMTLALVTGANGFLGSAVVRALLADGMAVRAFVRPGSDRRNLAGLEVEIATGDLTERDSLHRAAAGCSAVLHVAADYRLWVADSAPMYRANVEGSVNVLEAAAASGAARMVYTSSVAVLGINRDRTPADEDTPVTVADMVGHYKRSKFLAEQAVRGARASSASPS